MSSRNLGTNLRFPHHTRKNPKKHEPNAATGGKNEWPTQTGNYGREQAWHLLTEWTQSESLRKHALAVEACVAACGEAEADRLGLAGEERAALVELYSTTALLHDFDYERHPTAESTPSSACANSSGWAGPQELRTAILGHAQYSGVPRVTHLAKALFACDELAGFLTACALVKPTKAIADVEVAEREAKR